MICFHTQYELFFQIKFHPAMKFYSFHPGMKLTCKKNFFHPGTSFIPGLDFISITCKRSLRHGFHRCQKFEFILQMQLWASLYNEIFLSQPWNFYFERKVSKYFRKRNVCREILFSLFTQSSFIHTIMTTFHS